jgi:hypothetical protein
MYLPVGLGDQYGLRLMYGDLWRADLNPEHHTHLLL